MLVHDWAGHYRLTISGQASIHDLAGFRLDGNRDGVRWLMCNDPANPACD